MTDPYVYPGTSVLRNLPGIRDGALLDRVERSFAVARAREGCPTGKFDLSHLQAIHRHLFQDVYDWAGDIRSVRISKGGSVFMPPRLIEQGMADVHKRLGDQNYLKRLSHADFAKGAANIVGDINHIHPFREGNGRTQLQYLDQLAAHAGHRIDLRRIQPEPWIKASIASHDADYAPMAACILDAIEDRVRLKDRGDGRGDRSPDKNSRDDRDR